jgi:hypothetical protein
VSPKKGLEGKDSETVLEKKEVLFFVEKRERFLKTSGTVSPETS